MEEGTRIGTVLWDKYCMIIEEWIDSEHFPRHCKERMHSFRNDDKGVHYRCVKCGKKLIRESCYKIITNKEGKLDLVRNFQMKPKKKKLSDLI